ncbi:MAG: MBL fold metallo-hydrolase [bacterium]|nr:MBL fold metallo-hydrolase [bacterium]
MVINWYGEGCFKIQTSDTVILIDAFDSDTGLTPPRFKSDITLSTDAPFIGGEFPNDGITGPGSYEIKDIEIVGYPLATNQTVYILKVEDMRLGFLGHTVNKNLSPEIVEKISGVDILFIPAGGIPYISQEDAAKLIKQIDPRLVVASFFKISGLKRKSDDYKDFLKEIDQKCEPQDRLTIKQKDLPTKTQAVVLKKV